MMVTLIFLTIIDCESHLLGPKQQLANLYDITQPQNGAIETDRFISRNLAVSPEAL
jgi:hypothetical protein